MKIDYISDLHFDMWFDQKYRSEEEIINGHLSSVFEEATGEVLIIAGDIGHHNEQNHQILKIIQEQFNYKKIFCVFGNHDYYLMSREQEHFTDSFKRIEHFQTLIEQEKNIHLLDGNVIEYSGIRFGGAMGWYDGEYIRRIDMSMNRDKINNFWQECMNDANYIYGLERFDSFLHVELEKIRKVYQSCDVMITHVNPSIDIRHIPQKYQLNKLNGFFSFDGQYFLENTTAKYWIFGHTHTEIDYKVNDVRITSNPLGYPNENVYVKIKSFTI